MILLVDRSQMYSVVLLEASSFTSSPHQSIVGKPKTKHGFRMGRRNSFSNEFGMEKWPQKEVRCINKGNSEFGLSTAFMCTSSNENGSNLSEQVHENDVLNVADPQKAKKQLGALDNYFNKLEKKGDNAVQAKKTTVANVAHKTLQAEQYGVCSEIPSSDRKFMEEGNCAKLESELNLLDDYFKKLKSVQKAPGQSVITKPNLEESIREEADEDILLAKEFSKIATMINTNIDRSKQAGKSGSEKNVVDNMVSATDESYNSYLINSLAAINIAVYLFELASPVKTSNAEILSLPLLYGGKINELILVGEWWRLITPMFLHQGLLHVAFSTWSILTFGPLVDRAYGSYAFAMIFFLGGLSGNILSFFHGPYTTVGGSGPALAILGSWVIYLYQNKETIGEENTTNMLQKVTLACVLSLALSLLVPVDDWTHLGAAATGITFGALVCPAVSVNIPSKRLVYDPDDSIENTVLFSQKPDSRRLFAVFLMFVVILTVLFYVFAPTVAEMHLMSIRESI